MDIPFRQKSTENEEAQEGSGSTHRNMGQKSMKKIKINKEDK